MRALSQARIYQALTMLAAWHDGLLPLSPLEVRAHAQHLAAFLEVIHETLQKRLSLLDKEVPGTT